jgi:hypothetical protein
VARIRWVQCYEYQVRLTGWSIVQAVSPALGTKVQLVFRRWNYGEACRVGKLESPAIQLDLEAGRPMIRAVKHCACSYLSPLAAMFVAATQSEAAFKPAASRRRGRVTQVSL